jgi:hypothetical protein
MDLSPIQEFFAQPYNVVITKILINFGWMPLAGAILWGSKELWLYYRSNLWGATQESVLLAIDIPRGNEQSVKAVENMFTYFAGAHGTTDLIEKYWVGIYQLGFSFEIVSIDGYTQFIIRTPKKFRNLVESAIYSQYPDAEVAEINDYTEGMPSTFPDDEWDMWGAEFMPANNDAFPIKTYPSFGDEFGRPESNFKDPMATLMDLCSSLMKGEQLWYQIIVYPTGYDWVEEKEKVVKKILKEKVDSGGSIIPGLGILDPLFKEAWGLLSEMSRQLTGGAFGESAASEATEDALKMMNLKPKEKKQVEAIQRKTSQLGFEVKHRFIYIARKEVINKPKVVNGFVGYIKQFMDLDLNNLRPDLTVTGTTAHYFFIQTRINEKKRKIISAYKSRSGTLGRLRKIMSIEELATLWHFPIETVVKAPLIQKAPGRKAEPPMSLPITPEQPKGSNFDDILEIEQENKSAPQIRKASVEQEEGGTEEESVLSDKDEKEQVLPWGDIDNNNSEKPEISHSSEEVSKKGGAPDNLPFT